MKACTAVFVAIALAGLAGSARADQCVAVDREVAARAASELERHRVAITMCEPCGDRVPGTPRAVRDVSTRPRDGGALWEVMVDGAPVDLAYLYVPAVDGRYRNLAAETGCPISGVSPALRAERVTPTGVLIVPDTEQPTEQPEPVSVRGAPVASGNAAGPVEIVVRVEPARSLWLATMAFAGLAAASLLILFVAAVRRRPLLPRAVHLGRRDPPPI